MHEKINTLILGEPTNHLDIPAEKEAEIIKSATDYTKLNMLYLEKDQLERDYNQLLDEWVFLME